MFHNNTHTSATVTHANAHAFGSHPQYNGVAGQDHSDVGYRNVFYEGGGHSNTHAMNGSVPPTAIPTKLATPTDDPKLSRQYSNTSSGYGTSSSTGRQSVTSIFSRDQSLTELIGPENSLKVFSRSPRKISAPGCMDECSTPSRARRLPNQQSRSLTNLPEYSVDTPEPHENPNSYQNRYTNGEVLEGTERESNQHSSMQRQDTGHGTKVVLAGLLENSIEGERFQAVMMGTKKKLPSKQKAVEEAIGEGVYSIGSFCKGEVTNGKMFFFCNFR